MLLGSAGRSSEEWRHNNYKNNKALLIRKGHAFCRPGAYHETCLQPGKTAKFTGTDCMNILIFSHVSVCVKG